MPSDYAIVVDLDGCLADCSARLARAKDPTTGKMNWPLFYERMEEDKLVPEVLGLLEPFMRRNYHIVLLTGRPEEHRRVTERWLHDNKVEYNDLCMRPTTDRRPAPTFKKSVLQHHIETEYDVIFAIDDDPRIVVMYEELGIPCLQPDGYRNIQAEFNKLDDEAVGKQIDQITASHIAGAVLSEECPEGASIKWLRDYSVSLARKVQAAARG